MSIYPLDLSCFPQEVKHLLEKQSTILKKNYICGILYKYLENTVTHFIKGTLRIRQAQFELELRFVGYVYAKTLQLNITAKNENNSYALAA